MRIDFNVDYILEYSKNIIIINSIELDKDIKEKALYECIDRIRKELENELDKDPIEAMSQEDVPGYKKGIITINTLVDFEEDETNKPYQVTHTYKIDWEE